MTIEIDDLARIGVIRDTPAYMLPPEAWTAVLNMRMVDDGVNSMLGWESTFGTPGVAPHFLMPIRTASTTFWLYTSLTKAYGYDGTTHTDITRAAGGNYTASNSREWNGCILGGIPVVNNGVDVPQQWATVALATPLTALTNWPAALRAKVVRNFGPFLVALNLTDTGVAKPHRVRWSHPADPGSVPSSWDVTDPTKDAGENDLSDSKAGVIVDGLPLGGTFYIYKEASTWKMRFVGGRRIMDLGDAAWLPDTGILAPRCVTVAKKGTMHVVATQDDIIWHNGNTVQSILSKRYRRALFNEIDTTNYQNCFMFENPDYNEVWFCYPSSGMTNPNKALVLNYTNEGWAITEADGITFRNAVVGPVEAPGTSLWSDRSDAWDDASDTWSSIERRRAVAAATDDTKFWKLDSTNTRNGSTFTRRLQREGLALLGRKRSGDWIVDFEVMKFFSRMWPKIQGGPVDFRVGTQMLVNGAITWGDYYSFDPTTGEVTAPLGVTADPLPVSARALAIEWRTTGSVSWRLDGYKIDVQASGMF